MKIEEFLEPVSGMKPDNLRRIKFLADRVDWRRPAQRLGRGVVDALAADLAQEGLPTTKSVVSMYLRALRAAGRYLGGAQVSDERLHGNNFEFAIVRLLRRFGISSFADLDRFETFRAADAPQEAFLSVIIRRGGSSVRVVFIVGPQVITMAEARNVSIEELIRPLIDAFQEAEGRRPAGSVPRRRKESPSVIEGYKTRVDKTCYGWHHSVRVDEIE